MCAARRGQCPNTPRKSLSRIRFWYHIPDLAEFIDEKYLPWSRASKSSWRDDETRARVIKQYFAGKTFNQISPMLIEKFKHERARSITSRGTVRRPASVNHELATLSRIFTMAVDNGIAESNPCRRVKRLRQDNARSRYLSLEEEARLMAALRGRRAHLRPLVKLAVHTGMRRGEMLSLRWANVDFVQGVIRVTKTKTRKDRVIPMNSVVTETLSLLKSEGSGGEYVFSNPSTGRNLSEIKRSFTSACAEAGLHDFRFHDLRHTAATRLAEAGASAFTIAAVLGHATIQMSARYTHATDQTVRKAMEGIAAYGARAVVSDLSQRRSGSHG